MRNVGCTLYLALYLSSFHWKNTKDTCITVCSWYFYAYDVTLYHVFRCRFPVQMPQLAVRNKRRWFSVTWPATASLRVCVPHAVALWFSFSQRTHTLTFFFVPSLHGVYCSTLEIKPPGESQPNIAAACTKFIDWEEECCERECGEGSGPGRQAEQISWHLLYARKLHPLLWVEHIHFYFLFFFKETSSAVWLFYLFKKKNL